PPGAPLHENPPDFDTLIDFHQALSSLNSFPELLRDLGLVFDLEVPAERLDLGGASTGTLSVTGVVGATWQLPDTRVPPDLPTLQTSYVLAPLGDGTSLFTATPAGYGGPDSQLDILVG